METDTTQGAVRPDLDAIEARWGGARPGLLTIVDHAVKDVADLLAYVRHLEAEWDELNGLRVDERNRAYTAEQALAEMTELRNNAINRADQAEADRDRLHRYLASEQRRLVAAQEKIHRVETVRCWRNEDGRDFMFAEDLRAALSDPQDGAFGDPDKHWDIGDGDVTGVVDDGPAGQSALADRQDRDDR